MLAPGTNKGLNINGILLNPSNPLLGHYGILEALSADYALEGHLFVI